MIPRTIDGHFEDCVRSQQEVADILGVTRTAVYLAEQRAIAKLRQAIMADAQLCAAFPWIATASQEEEGA